MDHEIPYLIYFKVLFWLSIIGSVIYAAQLGGSRDYPYVETRKRWEDMLRLITNALGAFMLYQLCWGNW